LPGKFFDSSAKQMQNSKVLINKEMDDSEPQVAVDRGTKIDDPSQINNTMSQEQDPVLNEIKKLVAVTQKGFDQSTNRFDQLINRLDQRFDRLEEDQVWCCFL
jgi:uncharacterized coiled-coil protein SlyX